MCVMRTAESVVFTLWPPGPRRAEDVDAEILVLDLDVDLLGLGQHGDGGGRGVDAPLRLGGRHALHAVHAATPSASRRTRRRPITLKTASLTPPSVPSECEIISRRQPARSTKRVYMR